MKKTLLTKLFLLCFVLISSQAMSQLGWSGLGTGVNGQINAVVSWNGSIYVAGIFTSPGSNIAMWNGTSWSTLGSGTNGEVKALAVYGGALYAGGNFTTAGGTTVNHIAKWNGSSWTFVGAASGTDQQVYCMTVFGGNLFVGGQFATAGGVSCHYVGIWNGSTWTSAGTNMPVAALCLGVHNSTLYAGMSGGFVLATWSGSTWAQTSVSLTSGSVNSLCSFNSNLYLSGTFTAGPLTNMAKWNGSVFSSVGTNNPFTASFYAYAMKSWGGYLWAGGYFQSANSVANTKWLARWNGSAWSTAYIPTSVDNGVFALDTATISGTTYMFAGGVFSTPYSHVMKGIAAVGVDEAPLPAGAVSVYPNPAHGSIKIKVSSEVKNPSVEIYNVLGDRVYSESLKANFEPVINKEFIPGVYFVKVFSQDSGSNSVKVFTQKVVVE